jgi:hygromycin-B 4-O-kinase
MSVNGPEDLMGFVRGYQYGDHRALVHGDFGSNNVLAENGRITGVIDWSEAMVGDTLYDTANLFFWRPWLACMEAQCRYMELHAADRLQGREKFCRYQVRIGLQVAAEARADGDTKMETWALGRSRVVLAGA